MPKEPLRVSELLRLIPKRYSRIGEVVIVRLSEEAEFFKEEIGEIVREITGAKTVVCWRGVKGRTRSPEVEVIAGEGTETVHRENGCLFKLDVARVLFCVGNIHERMRIPRMVSPGEVVVDMFAGIGQFTIPIAKHANPERVFAIELNPVAFHYLLENIRINRVGHKVTPLLGDCEKVAPLGVADRVIMGLLHLSYHYLPLAMKILKPDGGIIHYHETVPVRVGAERPIRRILEVAGKREVEILGRRVVKSYSPGVDHVVVDAKIGPERA